eukprot:40393-Prorocentrum_minimum.AAC.3
MQVPAPRHLASDAPAYSQRTVSVRSATRSSEMATQTPCRYSHRRTRKHEPNNIVSETNKSQSPARARPPAPPRPPAATTRFNRDRRTGRSYSPFCGGECSSLHRHEHHHLFSVIHDPAAAATSAPTTSAPIVSTYRQHLSVCTLFGDHPTAPSRTDRRWPCGAVGLRAGRASADSFSKAGEASMFHFILLTTLRSVNRSQHRRPASADSGVLAGPTRSSGGATWI